MNLDPENLYFLACCDAFRDGTCEVEESRLLSTLRDALDLEPSTAIRLAKDAASIAPAHRSEQPALEPMTLFHSACQIAIADGRVDDSELDLLRTLAGVLDIPAPMAKRILDELVGR